jgi:phosphatidylglycerophosphatase A
MKRFLIKFSASGFYSSYSPFIPGTTGTVPAWLVAFFLLGPIDYAMPIAAVIMTIISVWLAGVAEKVYGHDAKRIVVDEWAGMFIAVVFIPYSLANYLIAFIFFRGFDWFKIFPANVAEKLPRGWGVTADDVVAGIQANLLTHLAIYVNNSYLGIL